MDIEQLVAEYNATEAQQAARLQELFYLLKARHGNRFIQFNGSEMLNNCWDLPDRLDGVTFLDKYNRQITSVEAGQA
jgi:hypothetical protein